MPSVLLMLFAAVISFLSCARVAAAQDVSLGPAVTRADVALTFKGDLGPPQVIDGAGVAGQPVFAPAERGSFFLALDVRGARGNTNGFAPGEFVPYLTVTYALTPTAGGPAVTGQLHPCVDRAGLRYGNNVHTAGSGPFRLTITVEPPIKTGFGRHTDMETGVRRWWSPLQLEWVVDPSRVARR